MRNLFLALLAATGGLYFTMVLWSLPLITQEADGLTPFDLRPLGYSPDQAESFLNALSDEGRVFYLETQHLLDSIFPGLLAVVTIWALIRLFDGPARWLLSAIAVIAATADYLENAAVARLLDGFDPALAETASLWTVTKSMGSSVVYAALLFGLARAALRRLRR